MSNTPILLPKLHRITGEFSLMNSDTRELFPATYNTLDELCRRSNAHTEILEALKKHLTWSETFARYEGVSPDGPLSCDILETKDLIAKLEVRL